ncbi:alpha/beta hydrolase [Gemmatimonas sp.]|uniref:alpha/beta hydrolase n=1 Tax=Gemmatimonas sp. TaxID=1962908 RepID=UPI0025C6AA3D|nr:alpha/beta hydrolase [Gemmatimonas sp.]MCA2991872.1 alpha/beta hydrolase [Gemmatimonas sp.]
MPASAYRLLAMALLVLPLAVPVRPAHAQPAGASRLLRASDLDTLSLRDAGRRIAYGDDSLHFGELRLPPGLPRGARAPVAMVIHGGCWISSFATLRNTAALADALAASGVATWNVEYRRADHLGGGWPGTFTDIARAADHLRVLAREYPLDTARVVAVGHSAGGHLALWLAGRPSLPAGTPLSSAAPLRLTGVVSLGGVTDLEEFVGRMPSGCGRGASMLLGGPPASLPDRVALASPIRRLPLGVPTAHVAGAQDGIAPEPVRAAYARAAVAAGDAPPANVTVPGGHFEVNAPRTAAGAEAIRQTRRLLGMTPP